MVGRQAGTPPVARMERAGFDLIAVGRAILDDPSRVAEARAGLRDFSAASMAELV